MNLDSVELFKVVRNTLSQMVVRFSGTLVTFIATLLIIASLGVSSFGDFVKVTSFVALFYLLIDFGLNTVFLRDHFEKTDELFGNLLFLRLILSGAVFLLVCIIMLVLPIGFTTGFSLSDKVGVIVYALTLFTEGILVSFAALTQKKLLQHTLVLPSIISSVVTLALVSVAVGTHNMFFLLFSFPLGEAVQILFLFLLVKRSILFSSIPTAFYTFSKKAVISSIPLALMLFLNVVYFRADTVLLSFLKTNTDVGVYGFSYKIFEFLLIIPTFFSASIFPILLQHRENQQEFLTRVRSYGLLLLVLGIAGSVLVFFLAPLITFIRGDLTAAVVPLRLLSFSLPLFFLTSLFQWVLLLRGKVVSLVVIYFTTMVINIALNLYFIPQFSYNAAATITAITEGLVFFCMIGMFAFPTRKNIRK